MPRALTLLPKRLHPSYHTSRSDRRRVTTAVLQGIRIPGLLSSPTPILDEAAVRLGLTPKSPIVRQARRAAIACVPPLTQRQWRAFYSSELQGIVRDASLMTLPIDDRSFVHGHGAYEVVHMAQGYLYLLDDHLNRFLWSVAKAGLRLPCSQSELKKIVLHTAAAGNKLNGFVRIWLTGGRGSFGISTKGNKGPALYVLASVEKPYQEFSLEKGFRVKTSKIPVHDAYYTAMGSNGQLPAVLAQLDAQSEGLDMGVLVDEDLNVVGAGEYDIGIITEDDVLVTMPMQETLMSASLSRILELLEDVDDPSMTIKKRESRLFTIREAQIAQEVFVVHPTIPAMGIVEWDDAPIGDGRSGVNTAGFSEMIVEDSEPRENSIVHTEIPYGYMTFGGEEPIRPRTETEM